MKLKQGQMGSLFGVVGPKPFYSFGWE